MRERWTVPRAGLDRDRLVLAGADLADEVGLAAVTLSALAARVGVRPPSLYAHLRDARDLAAGIATLALGELADLVAAELAGRSGRAALEGFSGAYRDYARRHPGRDAAARTRLDPAGLDPAVLSAAVAAGRRHSDLARAVLRGYPVPEREHVHAVRFLGATVHGFTDLESSGSFDHSEPGADRSWARVVDVLDAALRHWPATGGGPA
jgi:AcrR family transcriptional regulator